MRFSRFIGFSFLVGLIAIGGFFIYQTGISQGLAQAPEIGNAIQSADPVYSVPSFGFPPFFGFFGAVCFSILGFFIFFGLLRFLSCAWRPGKEMGQTPNSNRSQVV